MKKKICKFCKKPRLIQKGFTCRKCKTEKDPGFWKDRAWMYCSLYNRQKDADWRGYVQCFTCNEVKEWRFMDAGHFQGGRGNAVLFEDNGIHAQCKKCNGPGKGEQYKYGLHMVARYGQEETDRIVALKGTPLQRTIEDYKKLIEGYKEKLKQL